jgi:SIR2-like domain
MTVTVLTGAGCSVPARLPTGAELTTAVVQLMMAFDTTPQPQFPRSALRKLQAIDLLRELWKRTTAFLGSEASIEDLAYTLDEFRATVGGSYPSALVDEAATAVRRHLGFDPQTASNVGLDAAYWLHEQVEAQLRAAELSNVSSDHLEWISAAYRAGSLRCLATLNLDRLHERKLDADGIAWSAGFSDRRAQELDFWNDDFPSTALPLLKLHGSVDWRTFNHPDSRRGMTAARYTGSDPMHLVDVHGVPLPNIMPSQESETLVGSFNKFRHYLRTPYDALLCRFRDALAESDALVVLGYGFGDHGINTAIINWMTGPAARRVVVVHRHPDSLRMRARYAIGEVWWNDWADRGLLVFLERGSGEFAWDEVRALLAP